MSLDDDLNKLQGTWQQTSLEVDGTRMSEDEFGAAPTTKFSGTSFSVYDSSGALVLAGTFSLGPSKSPKQIDWADTMGPDAGRTFPAIYQLDNNRFLFCAGETKRPKEFTTKTGDTMRAFEKA